MTLTAELAIDLRGVTAREGRRVVLDDVSLALAPGRACAVVGPSESGTSVLLRVVAGLHRPDAGQVWVGGWDVLRRPDQARRLIGYVPSEPGLAERLTPSEQLALVAAQRGLSHADRQIAVESMLELVDLAAASRVFGGDLSRGQRRRLALALALVHDPPIILLDEPFDGLDDVGRGEVISVLIELHSMEKTLLIACQSAAEVGDVCDLIAPFEQGRLTSLASTEPTTLGWLDVVGGVDSTLRLLREHPRVSDIHFEGSFVTFQGPTAPEERSQFVAWLLSNGVQISGFGTTATPAGGDR
jgi:ABC-2 type transport system ATP-binding protein